MTSLRCLTRKVSETRREEEGQNPLKDTLVQEWNGLRVTSLSTLFFFVEQRERERTGLSFSLHSSWYHISKYRLKSFFLVLFHTHSWFQANLIKRMKMCWRFKYWTPFVKQKKEVDTLNDVYVLNFFPQKSSLSTDANTEVMVSITSCYPLRLTCLKKQWETNLIIDRDSTDELEGMKQRELSVTHEVKTWHKRKRYSLVSQLICWHHMRNLPFTIRRRYDCGKQVRLQ